MKKFMATTQGILVSVILLSGYASALTTPSITYCKFNPGAPQSETVFTITHPSVDSSVYTCLYGTCATYNDAACLTTTPETPGVTGATTLNGVNFVVDGMGGHVRWNTPATINAVVFQHDGGAGVHYSSSRKYDLGAAASPPDSAQMAAGLSIRNQFIQLQNTGVRLVESKWETGNIVNTDIPTGWFTRKSTLSQSMPTQIGRPAALLAFVKNNLVPGGKKLGTMGCSFGSIATFGARLYYSVQPDYQHVSGPLPNWRPFDSVAALKANRIDSCINSLNVVNKVGVCENDFATTCSMDRDCGAENRCARAQITLGDAIYNDLTTPGGKVKKAAQTVPGYLALGPIAACIIGGGNRSWNNLAFDPAYNTTATMNGGYNPTVPMDISVSLVGGTTDPTAMSDTTLGVTWAAAKLYRQLTVGQSNAANKAFYRVYNANGHCADINDPTLVGQTLNAVQSGLGLPQTTFTP